MKRTTKIWIITAISLLIVGCSLIIAALATNGWDFEGLKTSKYVSNEYVFEKDFDNISISTDTADVIFKESIDGKCRVECYEEESVQHKVSVNNGSLLIDAVNEKEWYEYIGINFGSPSVTIYLPKTEYSSLKIENDTGRIEIPKFVTLANIELKTSTGTVKCYASASDEINIKSRTGAITVESITTKTLTVSVSTGNVKIKDVSCTDNIYVSVSTGKVNLTDVNCKSVASEGDTGDIILNSVLATDTINIKRSTGDVKFDGSDALNIIVNTDTGDVSGSLLTGKSFITESDTGDIDVPNTLGSGRCEISTDTGDITIKIK